MLKDAAQHPKAKNKGKASGPKAKKSLMKLLAKKGMQFKSPSAAFQLGQITTLIVDAAGIITENKGSVNYVMIDGEIHDVASFPAEDPSFRALLRASVLGNNAVFQLSHSGKSKIDIDNLEVEDWDGTSGALLRFFEKHPLRGLEKKDSSPFYCEALRKAWPKVVEDVNDCFVSINKWSKDKENYDEQKGNFLVVMSGPTEVVIKHCTSYLQNGKKKPIDKNVEELIHEKYLTLTSYGDTVLAFAQLPLPKEKFPSGFEFDFYPPNFPLKELCFIGLVSMGSRYFKTVPSAVQKCKDAGVRLIMVSQDLPPAVTVLAKHVGLITHDTAEEIAKREGVSVAELGEEKLASISAVVLDGTQLGLMLDDGLSQILKSHSEVVIAGADSSHKLKIVRAAQKMGADQKVSVTGGQVGDCAALKAADVGIALPHSNDAVHCAADVVMTGGALDLIIECIELVRKKSEGGGCLLS
jgi:sodium/potassium-transporting ATPase subunit alpha